VVAISAVVGTLLVGCGSSGGKGKSSSSTLTSTHPTSKSFGAIQSPTASGASAIEVLSEGVVCAVFAGAPIKLRVRSATFLSAIHAYSCTSSVGLDRTDAWGYIARNGLLIEVNDEAIDSDYVLERLIETVQEGAPKAPRPKPAAGMDVFSTFVKTRDTSGVLTAGTVVAARVVRVRAAQSSGSCVKTVGIEVRTLLCAGGVACSLSREFYGSTPAFVQLCDLDLSDLLPRVKVASKARLFLRKASRSCLHSAFPRNLTTGSVGSTKPLALSLSPSAC
jgi:hypothetical protein